MKPEQSMMNCSSVHLNLPSQWSSVDNLKTGSDNTCCLSSKKLYFYGKAFAFFSFTLTLLTKCSFLPVQVLEVSADKTKKVRSGIDAK